MNSNSKKIVKVVVPLIIALISMFVVTRIVTSTEFHAKTIESLDNKKVTVMELTAASTAASAAITLIRETQQPPLRKNLRI
ncbi:MAG: hypothetical protein V8S08_05985 [Lachnoclostridium sp.]